MLRRLGLLAVLGLLARLSWADKIIMRDGKIYEGHIMGETNRSLLISNPPIDPKPKFIELKDVMTVVRESRPAEKRSLEESRFASVSIGLTGQAYTSSVFSFSPAAGISGGGAFRLHPCVEIGGEFNFIPYLSDKGFVVTDGTQTRSYETFYAYDAGFSAKFFPFFKHTEWRAEPYLTTGYHWSRLVPKGSGDELKGQSILGGAGVMIPWWKPLYWDFRFVYAHTSYGSMDFLSREGALEDVTHDSYSLQGGLSYRFL